MSALTSIKAKIPHRYAIRNDICFCWSLWLQPSPSRSDGAINRKMAKNLILAGFMGVGKTSVGQIVASRLGYAFIDTDVEIEKREGMTIPEIFAQKGEPYFRACEQALAEELAQRQSIVISTGGGLIINEACRNTLLSTGIGICLTATPEVILMRVGPDAAARRPMLRGDDPRARITTLLKERAPVYAQLHYQIDTSAISQSEAATRSIQVYAAEQQRITVKHPNGQYDIVLGYSTLQGMGHVLHGRGWGPQVAVVTDTTVAALYAEQVKEVLCAAGFSAFVHAMPAGEGAKHLGSVETMYRVFAEHGMERSSVVLALGGGVVGDVAGFAAATYLRGVPFVQVPTTLLAMADSSIGGKTGVDTDFGKNLVGAFKQPELVVIDLDCLNTLPVIEISCGMAEIIKAGLIKGGDVWERMMRGWEGWEGSESSEPHKPYKPSNLTNLTNLSNLQTLLTDAIELKREVVEEDPYEKGRRALLNLGHTFGHGIETWSKFAIKHGQAVSLGMVCALRTSQTLGLCSGELVEQTLGVLERAGLPISMSAFPELASHYDVDTIWNIMQSDKKKKGGKVRFVLIKAPGECFVSDNVDETLAKRGLQDLESS